MLTLPLQAQEQQTLQPRVESYRIATEADQAKMQSLSAKLAEDNVAFRQIYDAPTRQWVVVASDDVHSMVAQHLQVAPSRQEPYQAKQNVPEKKGQATLQLRWLTGKDLHQKLQKILGPALLVEHAPGSEWIAMAVSQEDRIMLKIRANARTRQVQISGAAPQVQAWQKIIAELDTPRNAPTTTQVYNTKPNAAEHVRKAAEALTKARLVSETTATESSEGTTDGDNQPPGKDMLGPVQIIAVDGTDALIIRGGNQEDVARILKIIEQIEETSEVSDPLVEVFPLQHVESIAMSRLLNQIFSDALDSDVGYGSLSVLPLVNPNSVLLVGSRRTVGKAQEVLNKLDSPSKSLNQFETFNLKHAKASVVQEIVENLFSGELTGEVPSFEPKALVIADSRTNILIVRAGPRDMDEVRDLIREIDRAGSKSVNELRIFKLKHSVASDLESVLKEAVQGEEGGSENENLSRLLRLVTIDDEGQRQLKSGVLAQASISSSASANALVIAAPLESMPLLEALIQQLDQTPDAAIELKIFPVKNGDAVALSEMLIELFGDEDSRRGSNDSNISGLRIEVDERTNSVVAAGSSDDLLTVEAILLKLDSSEARQRQNRVYHLKNKFAEDLAVALQDLLRAERDIQGTAPGTTSPFQQIEREVVIVPEISSNSLIVSSTPRYYEQIAQLISDLDRQEAMVMVQVMIGEVTLGDADEFGLELGLQDSILFDRSLLENIETTTNVTTVNDAGGGSTIFNQEIIQSANLSPGFDFGDAVVGLGNAGSTAALQTASKVATQGLASFGVERVSENLGFGGFVLSASSDSVSMLLRALQESRRLEILSRPQIMALNNRDGRAFVGQQVPFIVSSTVNQLGQRDNRIDFRDVGLGLTVSPRISPDGLVVMQVNATKSELGPVSEGVPISIAPNGDSINAPIINITEALTTVSAVSGQTIVLSGLLTKRDRALHRSVPLLSDIPLLGDLFRFDSNITQRTELLIILTPHIVRNRFEAEMIKQVESARMNWCLSDVVEMHGPVGLRSQSDKQGAAEAEVIYPENVPLQDTLPPIEYDQPVQPQYPPVPTPSNFSAQGKEPRTAKKSDGLNLPWPFGKEKSETP